MRLLQVERVGTSGTSSHSDWTCRFDMPSNLRLNSYCHILESSGIVQDFELDPVHKSWSSIFSKSGVLIQPNLGYLRTASQRRKAVRPFCWSLAAMATQSLMPWAMIRLPAYISRSYCMSSSRWPANTCRKLSMPKTRSRACILFYYGDRIFSRSHTTYRTKLFGC